jgi:hypothetical protein
MTKDAECVFYDFFKFIFNEDRSLENIEYFIKDDLINSIELVEFIEYQIVDFQIDFIYSIYRNDKDKDWNRRREPFAVLSIDYKTYEISSMNDFN